MRKKRFCHSNVDAADASAVAAFITKWFMIVLDLIWVERDPEVLDIQLRQHFVLLTSRKSRTLTTAPTNEEAMRGVAADDLQDRG